MSTTEGGVFTWPGDQHGQVSEEPRRSSGSSCSGQSLLCVNPCPLWVPASTSGHPHPAWSKVGLMQALFPLGKAAGTHKEQPGGLLEPSPASPGLLSTLTHPDVSPRT